MLNMIGVCKFKPTCSAYAVGCIERYGLLRGSYRTVKRLLRCHPCSPGGINPVE